jgi:hypothetical protein
METISATDAKGVKSFLINVMRLGILVESPTLPPNVSPDTLQSFGVLAIALGFVLIGLGGFSTYQASQQLQHQAELAQAEQKGQANQQIMELLLKNQQLQNEELLRKTAEQTAPAASPPAATYYYRPPSPPPPPTYASPPPVAEGPPDVQATEIPPTQQQATPEPGETTERMDPMEPPDGTDWREPDSLTPEAPMRYLSVHQQHVIADTLRAHGRHVVALESSYGDPVSREFAQELAAAFAEADWVVTGITEHRGLPLAPGVTVSAASFPPQPETRAVYEALLSAGIAVSQQLDPKQHNSETVLMVGAPL